MTNGKSYCLEDTPIYAHSQAGKDRDHWEPLIDHLQAVAKTAGRYGASFGAAQLAELAGWWHDLGKASKAFQEDVLGQGEDEAEADATDREAPRRAGRRRVDHSTAGARHAREMLPGPLGLMLAYAIAGHHGRLPDWQAEGSDATLKARLDEKHIEPIHPPPEVICPVDHALVPPQSFNLHEDQKRQPFQCALFTRMIFSALVDADRLETERYYDEKRAALRPTGRPNVQALLDQLNEHLRSLGRRRNGDPSPVDRHRADVLAACRAAARGKPGIYSLTVPTGGGKTLSSMVFALKHALEHGQRRVVYALPYTSIIEQNAEVFRRIFGEETILEHHSNLDDAQRARRSIKAEMAAENFDSPIVVTTNVQLFESLFSARASTCRKLHRLAKSVIVLDEVQSIPPRLLRPTLAVLEELVRNYHCTLVLCTATQPALLRRADFPIGLSNVTEIVPDPESLYKAMRRVRIETVGHLPDEDLAARLGQQDQTLCIVNTRKHAAELTRRLADEDAVIHLSAAMCPAHRRDLIADTRRALQAGEPCRVVSTQVIEAGVDVDFPVVYRALAGFDSIAQAAGRCNREGRRAIGNVFLFETDHQPPRSLRPDVYAAAELLPDHPDPLSLDAIEAYFRLAYWKRSHAGQKPWDDQNVMGCFQTPTLHQFREAESRFKWIDQATTPVIVPYEDKGKRIVEHLCADEEPDWKMLRSAQRYAVAVYPNQLEILQANTVVQACHDGRFWVLTNEKAYDNLLGLRLDVAGWDAASTVV